MQNSLILRAYMERTPRSAELKQEAGRSFPSGVTHDSRYLLPYGIYATHAKGARKWDVDGHEYADFFGGHGALMLGHNHPKVVAAARAAVDQGWQFAASNERELRWAQRVQSLLPSAERVRFTASGTEATLLALRLARSFTGKQQIVRFRTHFHGWHDHTISGFVSHFDGSPTPGVLPGIAEAMLLHDPGDTEALSRTLSSRSDIAAVIVEPTGGQMGLTPLAPEFLHEIERLSRRHGVLFIMDEVVTGFRVSPGGAQGAFGLRPDLTTLGKILTGGMPGGAVAGRADIMNLLDHAAAQKAKREKILHPGTFNAHPVAAATGTATLDLLAKDGVCDAASAVAAELRARLNALLEAERVPWVYHGTYSMFHLFMNPKGRDLRPTTFDAFAVDSEELRAPPPELLCKFRLAMLVNGVDLNLLGGGLISSAHGPAELDWMESSLREAVRMLRQEAEI
jgi:glutamate-1-semialdehyde 2,1-aminomutase